MFTSMRSSATWGCLAAILAYFSISYSAAIGSADIRRDPTVAAVEKVMPSVVNISSKSVPQRRGLLFDWFRDNWSPFLQELPAQYSVGSGVIIDEEGYVVSNVHVVEGASEIQITLADKRTFAADLVIGTRKSDVALLKIRAKPGEKFTPIQFAADDDLLLGETVIALGNPFGLGGSVSRGILSSKTRRPQAENGLLDVEDWIQTDAAINPGNSGGPLVNLRGELIGLNVAIFREGQGIGFAIPVKTVSASISEIFTPELVRSIWFGAQLKNTTNGVQVADVQAGSPAENAGLRKGDVILQVNRLMPRNAFSTYREVINATERGEVAFVFQRGNGRRTATVKLVPEKSHFNASFLKQKLGVTVKELTPQVALQIGILMKGGLVVTEIEQGSPADHAGFQRGLIIESIEGQVPEDVVSGAKLLAGKKAGEKARLGVILTRPLRRATVELAVR